MTTLSAFVANGNRVRIQVSIFLSAALLAVGCNRDDGAFSFDDASEEAQQAIAANVEFTLNEAIFQKWEKAQANLDRLPASELDNIPDPGGTDPVARGIKRLEASPRARQAIQSAGLSVKDFVLATVALAQAVKASRGGVPPTVGAIASNVRFVMAHATQLHNRGPSVWVPPAELSEQQLAEQEAMRMDSAMNAEEIATGEEGAQPTVPPLEDWSRNQPPTPPPPSRDSFPNPIPPEPPVRDSLTLHQ